MPMKEEEIARLARRYEELRVERQGWEEAWRKLGDLFLPMRYRDDAETSGHLWPRLNERLVNSTGILAMRTLAAGMQGGMTSPVRPWFRLTLRDPSQSTGGLNAWLDEVTQRMQFHLHQSNFYNAVHSLYSDMGTFGTGLMVETADAEGLHFHVCRAGEYVLDIDGNDQVDTFYRRLHMTARQIVERWGGTGNVPETLMRRKTERRSGSLTERFDVIHAVFPRTDMKAGDSLGPESMPYVSVYYMPGTSGSNGAAGVGAKPTLLDEGGFNMFPAFAPRWDVTGSDVYGRSPAMDVAQDCKMLQKMTATLREMQHKIADPPLVVDSQLKGVGVQLFPGGMTHVNMKGLGSTAPVAPVHQPQPQALQFSMQAVQEVQQVIYEGLYTDLWRLLIDDDRRQITATEVQAKQSEKMILLGPVVERLHKELLEPLIMRTYGLMDEWGALPEPPEGIEPMALDVSFESVLAQAQKMTATSSMEQGFAFLANVAQADQSALDNIDIDGMAQAYMERVGMPEACIRDEDEIEKIRQQRAQQQQAEAQAMQAQQALDQVGQISEAAKNLGQAPTGADGQTALGDLLGGIGGL